MTAVRADESEVREFRDVSRAADWAAPRQPFLRQVLAAGDIAAVLSAWTIVLGPLGGFQGGALARFGLSVAITVAGIVLLASQQLYKARVCRVRAVEVSRGARASGMTALLVYLLSDRWGQGLSADRSLAGAALMATTFVLSRKMFNGWLSRRRAGGRSIRPVLIVGSRDEACELQRLLDRHPELGFQAVGSVSPSTDVMRALKEHRSDTIILATSGLAAAELNRLTRILLDNGVHVHLSSGLTGVDHRRLRAQPLGREPMFYLEQLRVSPWQEAVKRGVDLVGASIALVLALPMLLLAALAIKLEDKGPVIFRSTRVGRGGRPFTIFKLRTMVQGADRQLHLVAGANQRTGPLFKSHNDPRVTKVGRLLRAMSIDELPQLLNVLLGSMSLVGPRPALPHEVAEFDDELRDRERVRPGITGLWQVEGRDDPSFDAYRRLDLYYVENWSLELDFVILLMTVQAVVNQTLSDLRRKWQTTGADELRVIDLPATATELS